MVSRRASLIGVGIGAAGVVGAIVPQVRNTALSLVEKVLGMSLIYPSNIGRSIVSDDYGTYYEVLDPKPEDPSNPSTCALFIEAGYEYDPKKDILLVWNKGGCELQKQDYEKRYEVVWSRQNPDYKSPSE